MRKVACPMFPVLGMLANLEDPLTDIAWQLHKVSASTFTGGVIYDLFEGLSTLLFYNSNRPYCARVAGY